MGFESAAKIHRARSLIVCRFAYLMILTGILVGDALAQSPSQPQWIWSPDHTQGAVPQGSCHFRKTVYLPTPGTGSIEIAADDVYEVFVNGKSAGEGNSSKQMTKHDIGSLLRQGKNVIAVRVDNRNGQTAGLAAAIRVAAATGEERAYLSNPTWRTSLRPLPLWSSVSYRDGRWNAAKNNGTFGSVAMNSNRTAQAASPSIYSTPTNKTPTPALPPAGKQDAPLAKSLSEKVPTPAVATASREMPTSPTTSVLDLPAPASKLAASDNSAKVESESVVTKESVVAKESAPESQPASVPADSATIDTSVANAAAVADANNVALETNAPKTNAPKTNATQTNATPSVANESTESVAESSPPTDKPAEKAIVKGNPNVDRPEFRVRPGFQVQHIAGNNDVGSLLAMAFNEFGQILASQEGGPLLMLYDSNQNGTPDKVRICCPSVFSCQGILPVSGKVYVVGDGPVGNAVYQLSDNNHDGEFEDVTSLVRFEGPPGEHGAHGLTLGPDGKLYVTIGNHTKITQPYALSSPHQNWYEGELVPTRYDDPRGQAQGIEAPGGGVIRVDLEGRTVELFAGGLRNSYDLAFSKEGDLFTHDSDMESDIGTPWHRPTRLINLVAGGEYGWRSGWAKWPDYLVDTLPAVAETDRGSPTGSIFYDHWAYPAKYRNVMFSCDWAQGQIRAFRFDRRGAGYAATDELFLEGNPLNVTDIDVGPDGWLYFCTGGRGTRGNIYRIVWSQKVPPQQKDVGQGIVRAIRQPQSQSAWGRQALSTLRRDLGKTWDRDIRTFVANADNPPDERAHALQLMHLLGPPPADIELRELSLDAEPLVRAKAAYLMGLIGNPLTSTRLSEMLRDQTAFVRRQAAEGLARKEVQVAGPLTFGMLASPDRYEAWAARRLLERNTGTEWHDEILRSENPRVFVQGATAMLIASPKRDVALKVIKRFAQLSQQFITDTDFTDMLRVVHVAIERGELKKEDLTALSSQLAEEFPAGNIRINRELTRLLVFLQPASAIDRMLGYLETDIPAEDKLHVGMHLAFFEKGMNASQRVRLLSYFEKADERKGGQNLAGYVGEARKRILKSMPTEHLVAALEDGKRLPKTALAVLFAIPESEDDRYISTLQELDRQISSVKTPAHNQLKIGILAVLARGGNPLAMGYLREVYDRDPERRQAVAMGLAQSPSGRNWDYLVRSIPLLEGEPAREVILKLKTVAYAPEEPEHVRQVILCGLRLGDAGATDAINLLQHWVGTTPSVVGQTWETQLAAWQAWFETKYPARPVAALPVETGDNRWTFDDLLTYLSSDEAAQGSAEKGAKVYIQASCADCHVHGKSGINAGPDLTTISRRFQVQEILESIIYPSQVISDQYASHTVITTDGKQLQGLVVPDGDGKIKLIPSQGDPKILAESDIDEILPNNTSAMPEGLLNNLSLEQIADLFAYLMNVPEPAIATRPKAGETR